MIALLVGARVAAISRATFSPSFTLATPRSCSLSPLRYFSLMSLIEYTGLWIPKGAAKSYDTVKSVNS